MSTVTKAEVLGTNLIRYSGGIGASDNDILISTGDVSKYDTFMLSSTAGAMDVFVSLDGTHFTTAPLTLQDMSSSSDTPALLTAPNAMYGFRGKFALIQVLQNGGTAVADGALMCGKI
jgi:hypothetical protein